MPQVLAELVLQGRLNSRALQRMPPLPSLPALAKVNSVLGRVQKLDGPQVGCCHAGRGWPAQGSTCCSTYRAGWGVLF